MLSNAFNYFISGHLSYKFSLTIILSYFLLQDKCILKTLVSMSNQSEFLRKYKTNERFNKPMVGPTSMHLCTQADLDSLGKLVHWPISDVSLYYNLTILWGRPRIF